MVSSWCCNPHPAYRFFKPGGLFGIKPPDEPYGDTRPMQEDSKSLAGACASGCQGEDWRGAASVGRGQSVVILPKL